MRTRIMYILFFSVILFEVGCTEEFDIKSEGFESVLVVESTITNEMKKQVVKLSRTTTLDTNTTLFENNANVKVFGNNGQVYNFSKDYNTGYYISNQKFKAEQNVSYTLKVDTQDGKHYTSSEVILPPVVAIADVYPERIVAANRDKDGVQVLVDTEDPTGKAKYFRYEYEETYKIVAPFPSQYTVEIVDHVPFPKSYKLILTRREPEEICYSTEFSTGVIQTSTTELNENRVSRFPVKYLSKTDAKLQTRYSILVKQYVQSVEAFTFYKILNELGSLGSLLSQGQPGYVVGNIVEETNPNEKVLGFFEASSMNSRRIYFNYEDLGLDKPPYFVDCEVLVLNYYLARDPDDRTSLYNYIRYFDYQVLSSSTTGIYRIVQPECSVCTYFSSNVKPDFWED